MVRALNTRHDDGAIAIIVAIFSIVAFTLGALVVERGAAYEARRDAQNAADIASLAAADAVYSGPADTTADLAGATAVAERYAKANFAGDQPTGDYWQDCVAPPVAAPWEAPVTPCVAFRTDGTRYTQVQVVVPGLDTPSFLGAVSGDVRALAQARIRGATHAFTLPCELCVLGTFDATGGGNTADVQPGNARIGTLAPGSTQPTAPSGTVTYGFFDVDDPPPLPGGDTRTPAPPARCDEGVYTNISTCESFGPGEFVVTSGVNTFQVGSNPSNAVFYLTNGATLGHSAVTVTGRSSGTFRGFAIIIDRNSSPTPIVMDGSSETMVVNGALYAPSATLDAPSGDRTLQINGPLVLGNLTMNASTSVLVRPMALPGFLPPLSTGTRGLVR